MNSDTRHKEEAERLRIGLVGGWKSVKDIVAWADCIVESVQEPPIHFIDISLSENRRTEEVAELLGNVPGLADPIAVMRRCLGDLKHWIGNDYGRAQQAAEYLRTLAGTSSLPEGHFGPEPYFLGDNFALARQGTYGSLADAFSDLLNWLKKHARE